MPYGLDCAICGQFTPLFATYSEMRSWMICAGWEMTEPNAQRAVCDECLERLEEAVKEQLKQELVTKLLEYDRDRRGR